MERGGHGVGDMDWRTEVELLEAGELSWLRVCSNRSISVVTGFFNDDRGVRCQVRISVSTL
jgi:hypothetical protein